MMTFTDLYPPLLADCRKLARRIVGDDDLAEQTAAEALLRLYEHWDEIGDASQHRRAWALRVTRNLSVDELRRRTHDQPLTEADVEVLDRASEVLLRMIMVDALADLPERQRRAIELRYLQDLSQAATAEALGVQPGTVATHISRAFTDLRRRLAAEAPRTNTPPIDKEAAMKINNVRRARQLIGTDHTVTATLLEPSEKGNIQADIGIPAVYRRRGQLASAYGDRSDSVECVVVDMYDEHRPLITERRSGRVTAESADRLRDLRPGSRITGRVSSVVPFGVFVEFDGLRGLIHATDLPDDNTLEAEQKVEVEITAVDGRVDRIGLRPVPR